MLNIRKQKLGDATILHLVGRLTFPDADSLRSLTLQEPCVRTLQEPCVRTLVLDLANVTSIDAAGMGALVFLRFCSKSVSRTLKLMNVNPQIERLLELTNLKSAFEICSAREMLDLMCRALRDAQTKPFVPPLQVAARVGHLCPA